MQSCAIKVKGVATVDEFLVIYSFHWDVRITYVGITNETSELGHPNSRMRSIAFGKADSLEEVLKAINHGWPIALKKPNTGIRQISMMGTKITKTKIIKDAYRAPMSLPRLLRTSMPFVPTVAASDAQMPMGASAYKQGHVSG